jgi:hypothetical protein
MSQSQEDDPPFHINASVSSIFPTSEQEGGVVHRTVARIGRTIIPRGNSAPDSKPTSKRTSRYATPRHASPQHSPVVLAKERNSLDQVPPNLNLPGDAIELGESSGWSPRMTGPVGRSITFHDEQRSVASEKEGNQDTIV